VSAATLDDRRFLGDFEAGRVPEAGFGHREHVRAAWLCLQEGPAAEAIARFTGALQRFAVARGKPGLYHETITWAFLLLVRERQAQGPAGETWTEFAARNPDLLTWRPSVLDAYYRPETLSSELARRCFVLPDGGLGGRGAGSVAGPAVPPALAGGAERRP
jgi:hypothetical protein